MKRAGLILGLVGAILIAAVWWFFLVSPQQADIASLNDETTTLEAEETGLRAEKAQLLEIRDNELTYLTAGAAIERLIPDEPELATFIEDVNILAIETGVTIKSLTPALPASEAFADFQSIAVFMDTEGQFFEILGFLYGLADLERLVRVDGVTLTVAGEENGLITLSAGFDTLIFTTASTPAVIPDTGEEVTP